MSHDCHETRVVHGKTRCLICCAEALSERWPLLLTAAVAADDC